MTPSSCSTVVCETLRRASSAVKDLGKISRPALRSIRRSRKYEDVVGSSLVLCLAIVALFGSVSTPEVRAETGVQAPSGNSPVGRWKTVDDVTGKVKSVVVIWEENSKLFGRIQKILDPDPGDPDPRCNDCSGAQKGKRVIGLRILWDLSKDGDGWSGGSILDPANGKTYKCQLSVEDGGRKLKVRGFIGVSLLGRTQYWLRE
jgi:uncharacterized protein (DUF2147 family)